MTKTKQYPGFDKKSKYG